MCARSPRLRPGIPKLPSLGPNFLRAPDSSPTTTPELQLLKAGGEAAGGKGCAEGGEPTALPCAAAQPLSRPAAPGLLPGHLPWSGSRWPRRGLEVKEDPRARVRPSPRNARLRSCQNGVRGEPGGAVPPSAHFGGHEGGLQGGKEHSVRAHTSASGFHLSRPPLGRALFFLLAREGIELQGGCLLGPRSRHGWVRGWR